ncbi:hypothetical protein ACLOJK_021242 [Asimina triloba]
MTSIRYAHRPSDTSANNQRFLINFIMGTYLGPDVKTDVPRCSASQRMAEGLPPYGIADLGAEFVRLSHITGLYYYILRNADRSVVLNLNSLYMYLKGCLCPPQSTVLVEDDRQFTSFFPQDIHKPGQKGGVKVFGGILIIDNPDTSFIKPEDLKRFKLLTKLNDLKIDMNEALLHGNKHQTERDENQPVPNYMESNSEASTVDVPNGNANESPQHRSTSKKRHLESPVTMPMASHSISHLFDDHVDLPTEASPLKKVGLSGPAMVVLASTPTIEKWNSKTSVFLTGTAKEGMSGPPVGLADIGISKDAYLFRVLLPGVKKDKCQFNCEIDYEGRVQIEGQTTTGDKIVMRQSRAFEMNTHCLCSPGQFSVSFCLPGPVDPRMFSANFASDGVLEGVVRKSRNSGGPSVQEWPYLFGVEAGVLNLAENRSISRISATASAAVTVSNFLLRSGQMGRKKDYLQVEREVEWKDYGRSSPTLARRNKTRAHSNNASSRHGFFTVMDYGARGDGQTDDSKAFMDTWKAACAATGPVRILIPQGTFLIGPVEFHGPCKNAPTVTMNGTVRAMPDLSKFEENQDWVQFGWLNKFTLTGRGTFDGRGATSWPFNKCPTNTVCRLLPMSLKFLSMNNTIVKGITSLDSKYFHFGIVDCRTFDISFVTITAPGNSPNTDGIHIERSSGVTVQSSKIGTGDDCISIGHGSSQITAKSVTCGPGHGISVGSLGKYQDEQDVSGITVIDCILVGTLNGIRIKTWSNSPKSTAASNMVFKNIIMNNVQNPILIDQEYCPYSNCANGMPSRVSISNVAFENIRGTSATETAVKLHCSGGSPCREVRLDNIHLDYHGGVGAPTSTCKNVKAAYSGTQIPPPCT